MFAVLEREIARDAGDPDVHWVGCFGYASRPDLPARPWGIGPDAVWMRCRDVQFFDHSRGLDRLNGGAERRHDRGAPDWYAAAFAEVQEQLRAGNSYEVNLTYRDAVRAGDPLATYLRLRASNPAPYAGLLSHRGTHLLSSSPERYATVDRRPERWLETKPIKGTTARGDTAAGRRAGARAGDRPEVPRREPDDRRPAAQRPVDGLRGRLGDRAEPDGGRVLRERAPAGLHRARPAARRRDARSARCVRSSRPGSMTGAPKLRTMQVIDEVEATPEGPLRRCVRLDLRRRPRRPRRGDPVAVRRPGRDAGGSAPVAASPCGPTSTRSGRRRSGRRDRLRSAAQADVDASEATLLSRP